MSVGLSAQHLSELVGRIYDCALYPPLWGDALAALIEALEFENVLLRLDRVSDGTVEITQSAGVERRWLERHATYAPEVTRHLLAAIGRGQSLDRPSVASRHLTELELRSSPYAQNWGRPQGLVDYMNLFLTYSPKSLASLQFARHERHGQVTEREVEIGALLIPHLRRAVAIGDFIDAAAAEKATLVETLDALRLGVVLAGQDGEIRYANRAAEAMLSLDGPLRDVQGHLRAKSPAASRELQEALRLAACDESRIGKTGLAVRLSTDGLQAHVAHVLPLAAGSVRTAMNPSAVAAIFINGPAEQHSAASMIASTFQLTPGETKVLEQLLSGLTVSETAARLAVAEPTVRTHLKRIFEKTGIARQSELIRLAQGLAPVTI